MKKAIFLAAITIFAACNKLETPVPTSDTITARIEQETDATKTYMDASNNIRWSEGDQLLGYMKSSLGLKYQILPSSVGKTSAFFEKVSDDNDYIGGGTELDHNVAYYPYSDDVEAARLESGYILDVVLPSEQTYVPDSFGEGAMAMVAVSEDKNFTFRNVLGGMKLQLKGTQTVSSISLDGKNNEKLSGAATVTAYTDETKPAISMSDGASASVTLNCGSGVHLNESTATVFIIALPPVTFSQGFTVTVIDSDGKTYTVETDKSNEVKRSSLLVMPPAALGTSDEEEPEISGSDYIDEYGINHGKGVKIGETVWAPVNCGYHATDFKYGKLYQGGRKYGHGYSGELYDLSGSIIGTYSDATVPNTISGPVDLTTGQSETNKNNFYMTDSSTYDWLSPQNDKLWNSGTESNPVKTEYDPCPEGWRVPTYAELEELFLNRSSWTTEYGQNGYRFSDASSYTETVPQVFFPAAGYCFVINGSADNRGNLGTYWSSSPYDYYACVIYFYDGPATVSCSYRAYGYSVRCVQVTD